MRISVPPIEIRIFGYRFHEVAPGGELCYGFSLVETLDYSPFRYSRRSRRAIAARFARPERSQLRSDRPVRSLEPRPRSVSPSSVVAGPSNLPLTWDVDLGRKGVVRLRPRRSAVMIASLHGLAAELQVGNLS